jgi:hypothetical protein
MAARRLALLFLPLLFTAQAQTPAADAEKALRARVTEFFDDMVTGKYRQGLDFVAEDTKDEYFFAGKKEIRGFKIDSIKMDESLAKATVTLSMKRVWRVRLDEAVVEEPSVTNWKIEKGLWVWSHEKQDTQYLMSMGPSDIEALQRKTDGTINMPRNLDQDTIAAAARKILQQSGVDKGEITISASKPSSDTVKFHNAAQGSVRVELKGVPTVPGFTAKLNKQDVNFAEDALVQIDYAPPADGKVDGVPPPATLSLVVAPFNQIFQIAIKFVP